MPKSKTQILEEVADLKSKLITLQQDLDEMDCQGPEPDYDGFLLEVENLRSQISQIEGERTSVFRFMDLDFDIRYEIESFSEIATDFDDVSPEIYSNYVNIKHFSPKPSKSNPSSLEKKYIDFISDFIERMAETTSEVDGYYHDSNLPSFIGIIQDKKDNPIDDDLNLIFEIEENFDNLLQYKYEDYNIPEDNILDTEHYIREYVYENSISGSSRMNSSAPDETILKYLKSKTQRPKTSKKKVSKKKS